MEITTLVNLTLMLSVTQVWRYDLFLIPLENIYGLYQCNFLVCGHKQIRSRSGVTVEKVCASGKKKDNYEKTLAYFFHLPLARFMLITAMHSEGRAR